MQSDQDQRLFRETLQSESQSYGVELSDQVTARLGGYYKLLNEWNPRLHLVAPCSAREFATRHVLESLYLVKHFGAGATVIDVGSGGGLPIIPCLILRPDVRATLIESSGKKSVFLREVFKQIKVEGSMVLAERFESVTGPSAEFVTCRALDRFADKLQELIDWSPPKSMMLLYGGNSLKARLADLDVEFQEELLPNSDQRFLFVVRQGVATDKHG